MTQHPSLKSGSKDSAFRSVLKRFEKVKTLAEKDKWHEEKDSVYKLPKVKCKLFKTKKTKGPAAEEGAEGAEAPKKEESAEAKPKQ